MNEISTPLLAFERHARAMQAEAAAYRDERAASLALEIKELREEMERHAAVHLAEVRDTEAAITQEAIAALEARFLSLTEALEAVCAERRSRWEEELFRRCVGEA